MHFSKLTFDEYSDMLLFTAAGITRRHQTLPVGWGPAQVAKGVVVGHLETGLGQENHNPEDEHIQSQDREMAQDEDQHPGQDTDHSPHPKKGVGTGQDLTQGQPLRISLTLQAGKIQAHLDQWSKSQALRNSFGPNCSVQSRQLSQLMISWDNRDYWWGDLLAKRTSTEVSYYTVLRPLNWTLQKTRIFVKAREVYKIQTPSFLDVRFSSLSMPRFVIWQKGT